MGNQSYMDFLSDSSPPSSGAIPSWRSHQILSFGGTSTNFVNVSLNILLFFENLMQEQEETLDSSVYGGVGLSRFPLSKPFPYLAQRSSVSQQLSSLYGFPNTSDMTVNNAMGQDTN